MFILKLMMKNLISIKRFRGFPELPPSYLENTWDKLYDSLLSIQERKKLEYSLEELYRDVESMCLYKKSRFMYENLCLIFENEVEKSVNNYLKNPFENGQNFLKIINGIWSNHCEKLSLVRNIFLHLDRSYVIQNAHMSSIWDMGLEIFRQNITEKNNSVKNKITDSLLTLIRQERDGETIDCDLMKSTLEMLKSLQIYKAIFEDCFYEETEKVYFTEAKSCIENMDLPEYISQVKKRLQEEYNRGTAYLDKRTIPQLITILENNFIANYKVKILDKGLNTLIESTDHPNLHIIYLFYARVEKGHKVLCAAFNNYMKQFGSNIITHPQNDKIMVQTLLEFKDTMDEVVTQCFEKNEKFFNSVKEAFEYFINLRTNVPAELIAKFIDSKLRSGNKLETDEDLEVVFDKIMVLFRFIHGKDVFEAFYKRDLAKRLLFGKSASVDYEKNMLSKLKQECGGGFTSKLEGMFKDMALSKDINGTFKQYLSQCLSHNNHNDGCDMTVNTLTMGYWPTYPTMNLILPQEMLRYLEMFNDFYISKHSGRKLTWQPMLSYCVVRAQFKNGTKELLVSLIQTVLLMLFNNGNELSYEFIKSASNINDLELKKTLQSLACGKCRVLLKVPKGREIVETDKFLFNYDFNHKLFRVTINQIQTKETIEEQKATEERVFQDRQYQIDAAIVRIMKTHKSLSHNNLVSELCSKLKFPVTLSDFKKRIESLIERDYMERDKNQQNQYNYL